MEIGRFKNCYIEKISSKEGNSTKALFLFHGYPCDSVNDLKNRDIALFLNNEIKVDCYIIHYEGLGFSNGDFNFINSILESIEFYNYINKATNYKKRYIYGHSWGGLVAYNVTDKSQYLPDFVFLASPLSMLPKGEELIALCSNVHRETINSIPNKTLDQMIVELLEIESKYNPSKMDLSLMNNKILIMQAIGDPEVSEHINREFINRNNHLNFSYEEIETDHSFSNRREYIGNKIKANIKNDELLE